MGEENGLDWNPEYIWFTYFSIGAPRVTLSLTGIHVLQNGVFGKKVFVLAAYSAFQKKEDVC